MSTTARDGTWELLHASAALAAIVRRTPAARDERVRLALRAVERALERVQRGDQPRAPARDPRAQADAIAQ